ncbi:isocitrate lyase/phosphoenolpyruvate mutase family protein [Cronobacter turicensis]|nr:isocitrate lyase/phosphoenolpyruvate mutase family protein [Cronobacter turicensis]
MHFTDLHNQNTPLLLANVWDAASAVVAEKAGFQATGTSSAAMAAMLGYEDGQGMTFEELYYIVSRIKAVSHLPLSVDLEAGFSNSAQVIAGHIKRLAQLGVVGVNLEDSRVMNGVRQLEDAAGFAHKLNAIRDALVNTGDKLFLNIRTDTYLLNHKHALQETLKRGALYQAAGADGLFVPCLTSENDIKVITGAITLPLNVMCMPGLPAFDRLKDAGVRRISMGNFIHAAIQSELENVMGAIHSQQTFAGVFNS